jgi:hypothetical protein
MLTDQLPLLTVARRSVTPSFIQANRSRCTRLPPNLKTDAARLASSLELAFGFGAIKTERIKRRYLVEETLLRRHRHGIFAIEQ